MKVLLSIKPEFVQEIFTGKKKYEYRKAIFTRSVDKVVVYSTKPVGMIVGEFTVENILNDTLVRELRCQPHPRSRKPCRSEESDDRHKL